MDQKSLSRIFIAQQNKKRKPKIFPPFYTLKGRVAIRITISKHFWSKTTASNFDPVGVIENILTTNLNNLPSKENNPEFL